MPATKQVERSATVAFCPQSGLLAAGTVAGAIDMSFSTSSVLEIFGLDFASRDEAPPVVGTVPAPERFNRLVWSPKLPDQAASHTLGLLAGGLADGSVCLWDPAVVMDKDHKAHGKTPLLAKMQKHTGAVKGLEFNTSSPNLLASGAADSDLCIWDLAKPTVPTLYPALKQGGAGPGGAPIPGGEITYISWNRKVQHILASCTTNGTTIVWDLKRQKPVISFKDPNSQRRASVLQWNPEVATQLVVASDDDRSPTLQMWDLRNSVSPLKEFVGHTKGVLGMAWSPHDPTLLLSSAKDNRTICWDVHTTEVICELPASSNWNFDVQWCPTIPGVFSTASFDGKVGVYNLHACTLGKVVETVNADFSVTTQPSGESTPLKKAPAWMKRPCGATFGFGGKLVSFVHHKQQVTDATGQVHVKDQAAVSISQLITEHDLISRSEAFEKAIAGGEKSTLQHYCLAKSGEVKSGEDAETWSFLGLLFEPDGRRELLKRLGFEDVLQEQQAQAAAMAQEPTADGNVSKDGKPSKLEVPGASGTSPEDFFQQGDDPDFFDKLPEQGIHHSAPTTPDAVGHGKEADTAHHDDHEVPHGHEDASHEGEEEVQRAMIAGNYEAAVESCFKHNRLADALLIANVFNRSDLFKRTMHRYMKKCPKPYMQIIRANVDADFETLVKTRPVGQWKETLALLATYTAQEEWTKLCDMLAARLNTSGMHHAAQLCYICAGNVDQVVSYWGRQCSGASTTIDVLQSVIERAVVMGLATGSKKASTSLSDLVTSYASILAAQGRMATALDYLEYVPGEASTTVAILKDRIYRSGAQDLAQAALHPPPFPFIREDVQPVLDATPKATTSAQDNAYGAYGNYAATASPAVQQQQQQQAQQQAYAGYGAQQTYQQQAAYGAQQGYGQAAAQPAAQYGQSAYQPAAAAQQPAASAYSAQPAAAYSAQPQAQQTAYSSYAPTTTTYQPTTTAASTYAQPGAQSTYAQPAAATAGYGSAYSAPPPAATYNEPAGQVYQAKRSTGAAAPTAAPVNTFAPAPTQMGGAAAAATTPMASAMPAATFQPQPVQAAPAQQPSYFMPATTTTAATANQYAAPAMAAQAAHSVAPAVPGAVPPAPVSQKPAAPPPPPGPPANISITTADVSKVPGEQKPIIASLTNLYNTCIPLANNPAKKREMDDNTKKIGQLFWKLNNGDVSPGVLPKLLQLCQAVDAADWHSANHIQVQMTTTDWDECGFWLSAVKRMIKMRQSTM